MKKMAVFGIAILLCTVNTGTLADGKNHGKHYGNQHHEQKRHKNNHHHYGKHQYKFYRPYRGYRYYGGHYGPNYYYPSYLGAALIGSALSYSLYHTHNGAYCYDNHGNDRYQPGGDSYTEVVGCHRMERLADGSERRIEVPISQCY